MLDFKHCLACAATCLYQVENLYIVVVLSPCYRGLFRPVSTIISVQAVSHHYLWAKMGEKDPSFPARDVPIKKKKK